MNDCAGFFSYIEISGDVLSCLVLSCLVLSLIIDILDIF